MTSNQQLRAVLRQWLDAYPECGPGGAIEGDDPTCDCARCATIRLLSGRDPAPRDVTCGECALFPKGCPIGSYDPNEPANECGDLEAKVTR
jgi:hypothetical protein